MVRSALVSSWAFHGTAFFGYPELGIQWPAEIASKVFPVGCDSTCACIPCKPCFSVRGHAWTSHVSTAHWIKSRPHFFSQAILKEWDLKLEMNYLTISDYKIHEDPSFVHHPILSGCFGAQGHRTNTIQLMQLQLQLNAVATIENKPYSKSSVDHP